MRQTLAPLPVPNSHARVSLSGVFSRANVSHACTSCFIHRSFSPGSWLPSRADASFQQFSWDSSLRGLGCVPRSGNILMFHQSNVRAALRRPPCTQRRPGTRQAQPRWPDVVKSARHASLINELFLLAAWTRQTV